MQPVTSDQAPDEARAYAANRAQQIDPRPLRPCCQTRYSAAHALNCPEPQSVTPETMLRTPSARLARFLGIHRGSHDRHGVMICGAGDRWSDEDGAVLTLGDLRAIGTPDSPALAEADYDLTTTAGRLAALSAARWALREGSTLTAQGQELLTTAIRATEQALAEHQSDQPRDGRGKRR